MTQLACAKAKPERPLGVAFHKQLREEARSSTPNTSPRNGNAVREFANKSAASAASPDSVKFQAVIKPTASAASLYGFVGEPPSAFRAVVHGVSLGVLLRPGC